MLNLNAVHKEIVKEIEILSDNIKFLKEIEKINEVEKRIEFLNELNKNIRKAAEFDLNTIEPRSKLKRMWDIIRGE